MAVYSVTHSMDGEVSLYIWEYPHQNIKVEGGHGWFWSYCGLGTNEIK